MFDLFKFNFKQKKSQEAALKNAQALPSSAIPAYDEEALKKSIAIKLANYRAAKK